MHLGNFSSSMAQAHDTRGEFQPDINGILWFAGWRGWIIVAGTLSLGLIGAMMENVDPIAFVLFGLIGSIGLWFSGTRHINANYRDVLEKYIDRSEGVAEGHLSLSGVNTASYHLSSSSGGALLVKPSAKYKTVTLVVGDSSVAIHDATFLDMKQRRMYAEDNTRELYYDQIASVSYSRPHLTIQTSDGSVLEFVSSREPDDALEDLQARLRKYKTE